MRNGRFTCISLLQTRANFNDREKYQNSIIKKHAEEYHQYTTAKYNELLEKVSNRYLNQTPNAPTIQQENASADYNSRSEAERETVANLIALSQFQPAPQEPDRINLLIDQMKAAAPDLPKPQTEIDSLLKLQDLITQRIQALTETPADDPIVVDGDDDGDEVEDDGDDADIE